MNPESRSTKGQRTERDASTWDADQAQRYATVKHGPDGEKFLDPFLYSALTRERLADTDVLDIGAGTGPWTDYALKQGARHVTAVDINPAMLTEAKERLSAEDDRIPSNATLVEADAQQLPFASDSFNVLASINVGCNLDVERFRAHFAEAYRVAQNGGVFVVTAPNSLLVPFTNAEGEEDIQEKIDTLWAEVLDKTPEAAKRIVDTFRTVLRATFVLEEDCKPVLVTADNREHVRQGTPILRRIPGLVVENNYWTSNDYHAAAESAGWTIEKSEEESFTDESELEEFNRAEPAGKGLGVEYIGNPPFLVMELRKE